MRKHQWLLETCIIVYIGIISVTPMYCWSFRELHTVWWLCIAICLRFLCLCLLLASSDKCGMIPDASVFFTGPLLRGNAHAYARMKLDHATPYSGYVVIQVEHKSSLVPSASFCAFCLWLATLNLLPLTHHSRALAPRPHPNHPSHLQGPCCSVS